MNEKECVSQGENEKFNIHKCEKNGYCNELYILWKVIT